VKSGGKASKYIVKALLILREIRLFELKDFWVKEKKDLLLKESWKGMPIGLNNL